MTKRLSEMSIEELWQLFPIFLVPHKKIWKQNFLEEKSLLEGLLKNIPIIRIEHIGSTAIPDIYAKDIVDILIEVNRSYFDEVIDVLKRNGYLLMYQRHNRAAFNKGYTEHGFAEKVYHLHIRKNKDIDELYFRDYLIAFPDIAHEYEALKLSLAKEYEHNRDGYTIAKTDFIKNVTEKAKTFYGKKY
ncbi:MAG: GrpB family protein [Bacilli bacterium]